MHASSNDSLGARGNNGSGSPYPRLHKKFDLIDVPSKKFYTGVGNIPCVSSSTWAGLSYEYLNGKAKVISTNSEIAMSRETSHVNITKAQGFPPPLNIAGIAAAIAVGAAQTAAVVSQSPPKKHMGGMATDEMNYTLLRGEAVLSRQATRRLGEEGVRNLNAGGTPSNQVVVVSPFKHYDRFIKSRSRRNRTTRKANGGF